MAKIPILHPLTSSVFSHNEISKGPYKNIKQIRLFTHKETSGRCIFYIHTSKVYSHCHIHALQGSVVAIRGA